MSFYERGNFLIIHGGRNDSLSDNIALNDTFLFDLVNYHWNKIILTGIDESLILPRHGHQSAICANQLFIFGGANNGSYIGSSMFIINLVPDTFNFIHSNLDDVDINKEEDKNNKKKISLPKIK